jgi:hypothetical protein
MDEMMQAAPAAQTMGDAVKSAMVRDPGTVPESRKALVDEWAKRIKEAKKHWEPDFKRMRTNMDFNSGKQWPGQGTDDDRYVANFTQRIIKQEVASLYAKNPKVVAKRRKRMNYRLWDGKPESLQAAMQAMQPPQVVDPVTGQAMPAPGSEMWQPDPNAIALLQDIQQNAERLRLIDKVGETLVALLEYYMSEQVPGFKTQMKQMIRRTRTTGVGYIELGFQRMMDLSDDQSTRISDMTERLAVIGRLQSDIQDDKTDPNSAEAEELRLAIQAIQAEPESIVREGLIWQFPQSTRIIPSPESTKLVGWVGTPWIAKEVILSPDRIKEVYGIDLGQNYSSYKQEAGKPWGGTRARYKERGKGLACVWHIFDRDVGLEYVVCDGYPDFLKEPGSPDIQVEQFFPIWPIVFNEVENEEELFPKSDVDLLKHVQMEYNRCKEALRQHRIANRPLYLAGEGQFDEGEQKSLAEHSAHDVIIVKAMRDGVKPQDLIAPVQKVGLDPNLYETEGLFNDATRIVGVQQAMIGGTANGTATESSIAAQSQQGSIGLDSDDMDDVLSDVMRAAGQILLMNLSSETAMKIAGPGAMWPELSRLDMLEEISLEIKSGSSGRPNQAQDAATFERMYPLLVQLPGISPAWLAERAIKIADDDTDLADAYLEGMPSIMAQNRMAQAATGNPATEPTNQGAEGANKQRPQEAGGTAKPAFNMGPQPNQIQ